MANDNIFSGLRLDLNSEGPILAVSCAQVLDFPRLGFGREKCVMLNSAVEASIFLDRNQYSWAANRRPREADQSLLLPRRDRARARPRQVASGFRPAWAMCAMPIGCRR